MVEETQNAALLLENVSKSFGDLRAVDSLSVRVPAGSIYGFLGPNGAGKTTTIRMIMDILRPDATGGRIELFGRLTPAKAKGRIGYMPEERGLYRKMTARKALRYFGAIKGVAASALAGRADEWLERVGLADSAEQKVEELSRGMHQKLQFAVTCISEPEMLILDEPFSGLDPVNLDLLKGEIVRMRQAGRTVLFSTHVMHEAENLCDFILLINRGRCVVDGTLDEIRSHWRTNTAVAELEGPTDFLETLPAVAAVRRNARRVEIDLVEGADEQELLGAMLGRVRVRSFEVKVPTLHEIFIRLVGSDDEEDS
jgi:ABC-2 type transport system ATP-binding protein